MAASNLLQSSDKNYHYHWNIIYDDSESEGISQDFVEFLVQKLENCYGTKCFYSSRDALAGKSVFSEFFRGVESSIWTLVILTNGFSKNYWAKYCQNAAFFNQIVKNNADKLIPVLIGDAVKPMELETNVAIHFHSDPRDWNDEKMFKKLEKLLANDPVSQITSKQDTTCSRGKSQPGTSSDASNNNSLNDQLRTDNNSSLNDQLGTDNNSSMNDQLGTDNNSSLNDQLETDNNNSMNDQLGTDNNSSMNDHLGTDNNSSLNDQLETDNNSSLNDKLGTDNNNSQNDQLGTDNNSSLNDQLETDSLANQNIVRSERQITTVSQSPSPSSVLFLSLSNDPDLTCDQPLTSQGVQTNAAAHEFNPNTLELSGKSLYIDSLENSLSNDPSESTSPKQVLSPSESGYTSGGGMTPETQPQNSINVNTQERNDLMIGERTGPDGSERVFSDDAASDSANLKSLSRLARWKSIILVSGSHIVKPVVNGLTRTDSFI